MQGINVLWVEIGPVQTWCLWPRTTMDVVQTRQCPELKMFIKNLDKGINYREIGDKFEVVAFAAYEKVNTEGTDDPVQK